MSKQSFLIPESEIHDHLLRFIDDSNVSIEKLTNFLNNLNLRNNKDELREILGMILNISEYHHRHSLFFDKIKQIFAYLKEDIKSAFTNYEIYEIFQDSKIILLILLTDQIIKIDDSIFKNILYKDIFYQCFFYPELKSFLNEEERKVIEQRILETDSEAFNNFNEKRQKGENEKHIYSLIRDDSIKEFVNYVNLTNFNLKSFTNDSIFETNRFLYKNIDLIKYAAFFGSFKIFLYLQNKGLEVNQSIWNFAIHGNNPKLIYFLENEFGTELEGKKNIIREAIKCHHNQIADYLCNSYGYGEIDGIFSTCFEFYNFSFLHNFPIKYYFFYACGYNHLTIVKFLLKNHSDIDVNETIIIIFKF